MLHDLASDPSRADQAREVMHALQTQLRETDAQLELALQERSEFMRSYECQLAMFVMAPFAYLGIRPNGQIAHVNRMAHAWAAVSEDKSKLFCVDDFFSVDSRLVVHEALQRVREGAVTVHFSARSSAQGRRLWVRATVAPAAQLILLAFLPMAVSLGPVDS